MSRSSSVEGRRDIPAGRGVESTFSLHKKDAKVFQKIVGAISLVMENNEASQKQEETFFLYLQYFKSNVYLQLISLSVSRDAKAFVGRSPAGHTYSDGMKFKITLRSIVICFLLSLHFYF